MEIKLILFKLLVADRIISVYLKDTYGGTRYKIVAEELKKVKAEGWITYADAIKLNVRWDRKEGIYKKYESETFKKLKAEIEKY